MQVLHSNLRLVLCATEERTEYTPEDRAWNAANKVNRASLTCGREKPEPVLWPFRSKDRARRRSTLKIAATDLVTLVTSLTSQVRAILITY